MNGQFSGSIAIGSNILGGTTASQSSNSIAIGSSGVFNGQSGNSIAIGNHAAFAGQKDNVIAIGNQAGYSGQSGSSIAIGYQSGFSGQGINAIAMGRKAGYSKQSDYAIAIGYKAGFCGQNNNAISLGNNTLLNGVLFLSFLGVVGFILFVKYKGKLSPEELKEKEYRKHQYILSKIKNFQDARLMTQEKLITGLPLWQNEMDVLY
jgi:hypothetical protein